MCHVNRQTEKQPMAVEIWFMRKLQRSERRANDAPLLETNKNGKLIREIRRGQSHFFGML